MWVGEGLKVKRRFVVRMMREGCVVTGLSAEMMKPWQSRMKIRSGTRSLGKNQGVVDVGQATRMNNFL